MESVNQPFDILIRGFQEPTLNLLCPLRNGFPSPGDLRPDYH
jgi:hypothetical protein